MRTHGVHHLAPVLALAAALASGCVTTRFRDESAPYAGAPVERLYVYSFLGARVDEVGKAYVEAFDRSLLSMLQGRGVDARLHRFQESPVLQGEPLTAEGWVAAHQSFVTKDASGGSRFGIPVGDVLRLNLEDERRFGATHRLVVFPARIYNSNWLYTRWDLVDAEHRTANWTITSLTISATGTGRFSAEEARRCARDVLRRLEQECIVSPLGAKSPGAASPRRSPACASAP
jgi:hypothetical protein